MHAQESVWLAEESVELGVAGEAESETKLGEVAPQQSCRLSSPDCSSILAPELPQPVHPIWKWLG